VTETDLYTGLPKLPPGYFWSVEAEGFKYSGIYHAPRPAVRVSLMKAGEARRFRKPRHATISYLYFELYDAQLTYKPAGAAYSEYEWLDVDEEALRTFIRETAEQVYEQYRIALEQEEIQSRVKSAMNNLVGDYPPKSIKKEES
jgi:hypothetical protein